MDGKKILEVIALYRKRFTDERVSKMDFPHEENNPRAVEALKHVHGMLDKMEEFVKEGRIEKAFRWLGFIQGVLWFSGFYSLEELKDHNRPAT